MLSSAIYDVYIEARDGSNHAGGSQKALETLGKTFLKAMQAQDVECAIETCAATIKAALRSVAVASGALHGKHSQRKLKPEAVAVLEGHRIFHATGERPTKTAIREAMERQGIAFDKKHARARWREVFARARLQNLPD
jgi:hypothetical protein